MTHGGKREGSGRPKGKNKSTKSFTLDLDILEKKPNSKLVNDLLKEHYHSSDK